MDLKTYLCEPGDNNALAKALKVSPVLISQWKTGVRPVPIEHCPDIERETGGKVTRPELRPLDWWRIWPELHAVYQHLMPGPSRARKRKSA